MSCGPPAVRTFGTPAEAARAAAETVAAACREAVAARGRFFLAVPGGNTPRGLFAVLAGEPYRSAIDWAAGQVFWTDERCVPPDHRDSNYRLAFELLLARVPIPPTHIHRMRGEDPPAAAAAAYEKELVRTFGTPAPVFDLVLLGMGADGHTASLFPGHPALRETARAVAAASGPDGRDRITLTLPVLARASRVLFLVTGGNKAEAVAAVLEGKTSGQPPAGLVGPPGHRVRWFLDRDAAALLTVCS